MSGPSSIAIAGRLTVLDGWRGVCAMLVALHHFHTTGHVEQLSIVRHAYLFVDFFFVLSGFVVTYAYFDRLHSSGDIALMLWRRLGRLWPLHLVMLVAFVGLELSIQACSSLLGVARRAPAMFDPASSALLSAIPTNLFLLHGLGFHDRLTWNIPSWSISAEFWTYALFALVVVLGRRRTVVTAVALAGLGALVVAIFSRNLLAADFDFGFWRCIYGFFIGHLVFRLVRSGPATLPMPTVVELGVVAAVILFIVYCGRTSLELAAPLAFAIVVWVFAQGRGAVSRVLESPPLAALGLISYSIYMVHAFVIALIHRGLTVIEVFGGVQTTTVLATSTGAARFVSFGSAYTMDLAVVIYALAVIAVSALTWRYIEMPCQKLWNGPAAAKLPSRRMPVSAPTAA